MKMYAFKSRWQLRKELCDFITAYDPHVQIEYSVDPGVNGRFFVRTSSGIEFEGEDYRPVYAAVMDHFREIRDLTDRLIK